jgi:hypothetical protein
MMRSLLVRLFSSLFVCFQLDDGTTIFFYLFGNQGNTIFSALGHYNGTMQDWFEKQYTSGRP